MKLELGTPDPRITVGAIVRGNQLARCYNITSPNTDWVVLDVLGPLNTIDDQTRGKSLQDIIICEPIITFFEIYACERKEKGRITEDRIIRKEKAKARIYKVTAARFDFVMMDEQFIFKEKNRDFKYLLRR